MTTLILLVSLWLGSHGFSNGAVMNQPQTTTVTAQKFRPRPCNCDPQMPAPSRQRPSGPFQR